MARSTSTPGHKLPLFARHPDDGWVLADPYPMGVSTRRALRASIRALCPPPPGPTLPDLEDRIELHVRRMLRYMVPLVALGFVLSVHLADWAPLWRFRAFSRMRNPDRDRAERILTEMGESSSPVVRMLVLGLRGLVLSTFYDQDEVHAAMEYRPLPFLSERVLERQRLLEPARAERSTFHEASRGAA
jgi:hypothetical protein